MRQFRRLQRIPLRTAAQKRYPADYMRRILTAVLRLRMMFGEAILRTVIPAWKRQLTEPARAPARRAISCSDIMWGSHWVFPFPKDLPRCSRRTLQLTRRSTKLFGMDVDGMPAELASGRMLVAKEPVEFRLGDESPILDFNKSNFAVTGHVIDCRPADTEREARVVDAPRARLLKL
jgi:hypothetical protein